MVYLKHWSDFHAQAIDLYKRRPERTRYLIKSHPSRQWLVLKVTDDVVTLKYRSRSTVILNRFETFNRELNDLMAGVQSKPTTVGAATTASEAMQDVVADAAVATTQSQSQSAPQSASNNKKKKKKGGGK